MLARSKCKRRAPTAVLGITALLAAVSTAPAAASAAPAPVQVSIFASPSTGVVNLNTNWFTKYVEKKFNMKINWVLAPSSDTSTKAALLLASGKYPDAFFDPGIPLASILKYGQEGVVVPLDKLINQFAPNVAAGMKANPTAREAAGPPKGPSTMLLTSTTAGTAIGTPRVGSIRSCSRNMTCRSRRRQRS